MLKRTILFSMFSCMAVFSGAVACDETESQGTEQEVSTSLAEEVPAHGVAFFATEESQEEILSFKAGFDDGEEEQNVIANEELEALAGLFGDEEQETANSEDDASHLIAGCKGGCGKRRV